MQLQGGYELNRFGQSGNAGVRIRELDLKSRNGDIQLTGAALRFSLPSLPELSSAPNQRLSFKSLQVGNFKFDSASIAFRMDSPTVWYLENSIFNWCGGKIRLGYVKIAPPMENFAATVYCDRLRLGELLEQFGIGSDAGDNAALNGTIPLRLRNGRLIIRNGFLYSTPGETGTLRFTPHDTVKALRSASTEMAFIQAALHKFLYNWTRLTMNTEGELLLVKFQADGRPADPLPFGIDEKTGKIAFIKGKNRFQGITPELNFKIPLRDTLDLYQSFNKFLNRPGKEAVKP